MSTVLIVANLAIKVGTVLISIWKIFMIVEHFFRASFLRATVKCAICGDRSHPTSDCPNKKAQGTGFGMHYEYSKFMASLDGNIL